MIGHAPGLSTNFETLLYGFHVPLFFFISGVLLSDQKLGLPVYQFFVKQVKEILIPYAAFFIIAYIYWLLTRHHGNSAARFAHTGWAEPIAGLFIGTGSSLVVNLVLWFFPALFCSRLLYYFSRKFFNERTTIVLLLTLAFCHYMLLKIWLFRMWFGLDCALYGVVFLAVGKHFSANLTHANEAKSRLHLVIITMLLLSVYVVASLANGKVDLNNVHLGNFILYFLTAFIGCGIVFGFSCLLPPNSVSQWLSSNTLYIFPLHSLFFKVATGVLQVVFGVSSPYLNGGEIWILVYIVFALVLVVPAIYTLNYLPFYPFAKVRSKIAS
jgi:acyltransferase